MQNSSEEIVNLLFVDDEESILKSYDFILTNFQQKNQNRLVNPRAQKVDTYLKDEGLKLKIFLATSGDMAIKIAKELNDKGESFVGGFFDMKMPGGMDGLETIQKVREIYPELLCCIVTAYQDRPLEEINKVFKDAEDQIDYLNKPFTPNEIIQKAQNIAYTWKSKQNVKILHQELTSLLSEKTPNSPKIILIDDDQDLLNSLSDSLAVYINANVETFKNVQDCLVKIKNQVQEIDLIITDFHLQGSQNGVVLAQEITSLDPKLPVILISGDQSLQEDNLDIKSFWKIMYKPMHYSLFFETVEKAIEYRSLYKKNKQANIVYDSLSNQLEFLVKNSISQIKDQYEKLNRSRQNLISQSESQHKNMRQLAMMGEVAANLTHEINNPLTSIIGASDCIKITLENKNLPQETKQAIQKHLEIISATSKHMSKIVQNFLNMARMDIAAKSEVTSMNKLIEGCLQLSKYRFDKEKIPLKVDNQIPLEDDQIECQSTQIIQTILNLMNNAIDAISDFDEKWVKLSASKIDNEYLIKITDSGGGIPLESQKSLFSAFFTTKSKGKGTGLGLSISKSIINEHNGSLTLNNDSENTEFVIRLPSTKALENKSAA